MYYNAMKILIKTTWPLIIVFVILAGLGLRKESCAQQKLEKFQEDYVIVDELKHEEYIVYSKATNTMYIAKQTVKDDVVVVNVILNEIGKAKVYGE